MCVAHTNARPAEAIKRKVKKNEISIASNVRELDVGNGNSLSRCRPTFEMSWKLYISCIFIAFYFLERHCIR